MGTKDLDLDNPREYEDLHPTILRKLKSISVGLQVLTTKVDTLNKELKDINTKLSAAIAESESTLIRRTLAPLPKKSHWESHRGTKFSAQFWENACLCVIFFVRGLVPRIPMLCKQSLLTR